MANKIYITHSDGVTIEEAIKVVYSCILNDVKPGEAVSYSNGMVAFRNDKTKHPSFQVWGKRK